MGAMLALSCLQRTRANLGAALAFSGAASIHAMTFYKAEGFLYYGSAALADFIAISIISLSGATRRLGLGLATLSFVSIILNFYGWISWANYMPPNNYNNYYIFTYVTAIAMMIEGTRNVGSFTYFRGLPVFRGLNVSGGIDNTGANFKK